jgi:hypothetical protein
MRSDSILNKANNVYENCTVNNVWDMGVISYISQDQQI